MTATTGTCIPGCITDHNAEPGHHYQATRTVTDLDGRDVEIVLFHVPATGRTGVSIGGYEFGLPAANQVSALLQQAFRDAIDVPGVLTDLIAGGHR